MAKQILIAGAVENISLENNLLLVIRRHCLECMGGNKEDVVNCKATAGKSKCRLWDYRQGAFTTAEKTQKRLLYIINAHCRECIGTGTKVAECRCDGSEGFSRCNLFELRSIAEGK